MFKSNFCCLLGLMVVLLGCSNDDERPMTAKFSHRYTQAVVLSADLSKDAAVSAILTDDQQVAVWDNRTQKPLAQWHKKQFDDELFVLALSGNARFLCVAGHWTVTMLNVTDGSVVTVWDVQGFSHSATVSALHVDETASKVLVGMSDGAVLSVNLKTGNALKLDHHRLKITRLSYDASGQFALSGGLDKKLAYWRVDNGEVVYQHKFRSRVTALSFDQASNRLFVSDALTSHWILDTSSGEKMSQLNYFERFRWFRRALFVEQGKLLFTSSPKQRMTLWDSDSGEELKSWDISAYNPNATVLGMATNEANELVTLSADGVLQVWDYRPFL